MMGPDASARYLYERELPESGLDLRLYYSPQKQYDYRLGTIDTVLIELEVSHDDGGTRLHKSWGRDFTSSERLLDEDDAQTILPPLYALDMSLDEVEQVKLEDLQELIDEIDKIEDTPDALKQIERAAESSDLWLMADA